MIRDDEVKELFEKSHNTSFLGRKKMIRFEKFVFEALWNKLIKLNPGDEIKITDKEFEFYENEYYFIYGTASLKRQYLSTIFATIGRIDNRLSFTCLTSYGDIIIRKLPKFNEDIYCTYKRAEKRGLTTAYNDPLGNQTDRILKKLKELEEE